MLKWVLSVGVVALTTLSFGSNAASENRVVSVGAAVTELVVAFEEKKSLVAVDVTSRFPAVESLPKVGYHRALAAEGILAMGPNHLIGSKEMGPDSTLETVQQAGVTVTKVNEEYSVEGLLNSVSKLNQIFKNDQVANQISNRINEQTKKIKKLASKATQQPTILFVISHEGRPTVTAGNNTTPDAIIDLVGGLNPTAAHFESYKPISNEALIEMNPDVIFVSARNLKDFGTKEAIVKKIPAIASTTAGKQNAIYTVNSGALVGGFGLSSLNEAERLAELLYQ